MKRIHSSGSPGAEVAPVTGGQYDPPCQEPCYFEIVEQNLYTSLEPQYGNAIDISRIRVCSILVINNGLQPVIVQPELGPDGLTWGAFGETAYIVEAGGKRIFIPQYFLRYVRVKYRSWRSGKDTLITVWFQGQS